MQSHVPTCTASPVLPPVAQKSVCVVYFHISWSVFSPLCVLKMSFRLTFIVSIKITQKERQQMDRACASGNRMWEEGVPNVSHRVASECNASRSFVISFGACNYLSLQLWQLMFTYRAIGSVWWEGLLTHSVDYTFVIQSVFLVGLPGYTH